MFIGLGPAAGVQTYFPFWLMATLSGATAVGMMPWLVRRSGRVPVAIIVGCTLVAAATESGLCHHRS